MPHWKRLTNPDYIGAYALDEGKDQILTIKSVGKESVVGADGKREDCIVARFQERDVKPMIMNATNCKTITKLYKTPDTDDWKGRKIQIYVDHVKAFGDVVEALRIRPFVPKVELKESKRYVCADCGAELTELDGHSILWIAQKRQERYGKVLCNDCAKRAAEDKTNIENEARELTGALDSLMEEETNG